jgi:DNA-binding MarR family transcriptional regulator
MTREQETDRALELFNATVTLVDPVRLRAWADLGLTVPTLKVLLLLREHPGMPAGLLAQQLGVTPSTITGLVDRLVAQGLVRREEDPRDRRLVRNYLTPVGASTVGDIQRHARELVSNVLAKLDDEQLTRLCAALGDLIDASHRVDEHAPVGV